MGIININDTLTKHKINWREHIQRMDDNRLPQKKLNNKPEGRRNVGRPQTRWEDDFREKGTDQGDKALQLMMMMMMNLKYSN